MSGRRQWAEDSTVTIRLTSGGSVTLVFKGNMFDLTQPERELIAELSTVVQKFKDGPEVLPDRELEVMKGGA
jgi:hypothetical protein